MMLFYYVNYVLAGTEARYSPLEKDIFTLVITTRKLKPYFQAHLVTLLTTLPLWRVIHKPNLRGRMTKWLLELSEYEIDFHLPSTVQVQALVDFVVENTLLTAM